MMRRLFPVRLLLTLVAGAVTATAEDAALRKLKPFLEKNCHACHGPEKQKHDLRFDFRFENTRLAVAITNQRD